MISRMSKYGCEEKEEEDNNDYYSSSDDDDDEEFEVELQRRFAELEKQGLVCDDINIEEEEDEDEYEDGNNFVDIHLSSTHNTTQQFNASHYLDEIKRNMSATTDSLVSSLYKLTEEVKSIPSPPVSARRKATLIFDKSTTEPVPGLVLESKLLTSVSDNCASDYDMKQNMIEEQKRIEQERARKQMEIQKKREERRAQHEQYLLQKKEEMRLKKQQHELEMARMEQLRIEQEQQEQMRREEKERMLREEQKRMHEAQRAKLESERQRIMEERKRKDEMEKKRIAELQEQERKEKERRILEDLERKRIEEENLRQLEEKREMEERERLRKERLAQMIREEQEIFEKKKQNFFEQSLASMLAQQTYYSRTEKLTFSSKALLKFNITLDPQVDISPLQRRLTEWQNTISKCNYHIRSSLVIKNSKNEKTINVVHDINRSAINLLDEQLIQFNFGYNLQDNIENIVSMVFSVEKLDGIEPLVLQKCKSLRSLTLDQNNITFLRDCLKSTSIEYLSVNQNKLSSLFGIEDLKNSLKEISANSNQITCIDSLQECAQLTNVDLSMNAIQSLDSIGNLENLEVLDMYRNFISEIPNLNRLAFLMIINLGRNNLEYIDPSVFSSCKLLDELILYENKLEEVPKLQNVLLRSLSLNGNVIRKLPDHFLFSPVLTILNLESNQISSLQPFSSCVMLQSLNLSFNNITYLSDLLCLEPCKRLLYIRINDNPVSTKIGYREVLIALLPKVETIDNDRIDDKEKSIVRNYALTHSTNGLSNYSSRIYRRLVLDRTDPPDFDLLDDYEFVCTKQVTEKKRFETMVKNQLYVPTNHMDNQRRMSINLDLKAELGQQRRQMRTRHFEEHLHYDIKQARNVFLPNEEYRRDKAARVLQRLCRLYQKKRIERSHFAAIQIQKLWRGYSIRAKNLPWMLPLLKLRHQKATVIQAYWRGYYVRRLIREARRLEEELQFELRDFTDNFEEHARFLDQASSIDMVGNVPRRISKSYPPSQNNENSSSDFIKLPDIAIRNVWEVTENRTITEQEEIIHQEIDEQLEQMKSPIKQEAHPNIKRSRKDLELLAQEWGLSGNSAALAALIRSKKRKPQNHKKHKNMSAMERFSHFKHVALKEPKPRRSDDEKLEVESVSSSSSSGSSENHFKRNGGVKLPSIMQRRR